jgi:RNA polymerase sigma-70 factor (ECF subfamily)
MSAGETSGLLAVVLRGRNTPQIATKSLSRLNVATSENNSQGAAYSLVTMSQIAAEQLLAEHTPALRDFLGARCRDADLTAEMLQEVAARLVTATPRLSLNGNARGYLFRIAGNVWRDHLRRELVRRRATVALESAEPALADAADARLLERELRAAVRTAVRGLPPAQRDVVELRQQRGLTFQEIADRLGRPLGTVLTQMRAALARIGAALENYR